MVNAHTHSDLRETIRRAATKLAHDVSEATEEAMSDASIALKHSAKDLRDRASTQSRYAARAVRKSARAHPIAWVAASAGAGLVIGAALMLRRR